MSLIKSWLDISNLLSTIKKPCRETAGLFYLKQDQACLRLGANNKARSSASALQGFFFVKQPAEDHSERSEL